MVIEVNEKQFIDHVARICIKNLRTPCAICVDCPFKELALKVAKEKRWKMPSAEALKKLGV